MGHLTNVNTGNLRHILSVGLATVTIVIVLTYALGAAALLQTPQAEQGHNLFMSIFRPLMQVISGGHSSSMSQMHGGDGGAATVSDPQQMHGMSQGTMGLIGNNILGSPATLPAGGLAVVVVMAVTPLAVAAFIVSWNRKSFLVAGLLVASGIILMILPLANMNFVIPGPIIGVVVGLAIFGLGMAMGIRSARPTAVTAEDAEELR
jgi:hypothetical protein